MINPEWRGNNNVRLSIDMYKQGPPNAIRTNPGKKRSIANFMIRIRIYKICN